jgi:excisionase family DNA binding protein
MEHSELEESYLTVAEVAQLLKLNQQTVRNWIDQGSLPALRVGRRVRIKRSDLERVLADGYSPGAASEARQSSPSAEAFWGGEPVGIAEPAPAADGGGPADGRARADGGAPVQITRGLAGNGSEGAG